MENQSIHACADSFVGDTNTLPILYPNIRPKGGKTLSDEAIEMLCSRDEDPSVREGFRLISTASYSASGSLPPSNFPIPDLFESYQTLLFLELTEPAVAKVWDAHRTRTEQFPDRAHILKSAIDYVKGVDGENVVSGDEAWNAAFEKIGINKKCRARFMDPQFAHMREMSTPKEITIAMMELRFEFLEGLDWDVRRYGQPEMIQG